jgi:hypothetical protein
MAETVKSLSDILSDLADNTSGDISPEDVRNLAVSTYQLDYSEEVSVTTTATLTIGKRHVCSGTSADYTVTLPAASGNAGKQIQVRMASGLTKLVTVDGNSTELIDGAQTRVMWANEVAVLECDGTGWTKIGGKSIPFAARQRASATQTPVTSNTNVLMTLGTTVYDNSGLASDTANSRVVIPRTGVYTLTGSLRFGTGPSGVCVVFTCNNDGSTQYGSSGAGGVSFLTIAVSSNQSLTKGDFVRAGGYYATGTSTFDGGVGNTTFLEIQEVVAW